VIFDGVYVRVVPPTTTLWSVLVPLVGAALPGKDPYVVVTACPLPTGTVAVTVVTPVAVVAGAEDEDKDDEAVALPMAAA